MGTGFSGDYKNTQGSLKPEHLMEELRARGNKFTVEDVVIVTKTKKGELVWLEQGDSSAGLIHIIERHKNDLERKYGITEEKIPVFVKDVFTDGIEISSKEKNNGLEKIYQYKGEYIVITGVGTNGFIVSIYPGG